MSVRRLRASILRASILRASIALVALAAAALAGCGDTPDPGYLLVKARVISAIARVEGEPARATPRPGETVTLEWGLASPEALEPSTWAFIACPPSAQQFGIPICGDRPFVISAVAEPSSEPPRLTIEVPAAYEPNEVVVIGAICVGGVVNTMLDPAGRGEDFSPCRDEGFGQLAVASVHVEQEPADRNLNPAFASVTLGDAELTEAVPLARQPCQGGTLPEVRLDDEVPIVIAAADGSREPYFDTIVDETREEELTNELFITEGTLNRRYTVIDDSTPQGESELLVEADPDDPLPAEGRTVPLLVVMRDGRGGQAELRRGFCLLP